MSGAFILRFDGKWIGEPAASQTVYHAPGSMAVAFSQLQKMVIEPFVLKLRSDESYSSD